MIATQKHTDAEYIEHQFRHACELMRSFGKSNEISCLRLDRGSAVLTMRSRDGSDDWHNCVLDTPFLNADE